MYGYTITADNEVIGQMPDGTSRIFGSVDEYDDCFYDSAYLLNNCFSCEMPELF